MNTTLKNVLAIVGGIIIGSVVNMGIIMLSGYIIPPPAGADVTTMEGLKASMHLFEPRHFIMPFLAHALGTLVGAMVAAAIAPVNKTRYALAIGVWFLIGGVINVFLIPSPTWFIILDVLVAYLPMAYVAAKLIDKKK